MSIKKYISKHISVDPLLYVGKNGDVFIDLSDNSIRVSDGVTAGGIPVTGITSGVTSVHGRTGNVIGESGDYTKSQVGLPNVDNTSDINKPVSIAQATADGVVLNTAIQRVNHTGTQLSSTISDFSSSVRANLLTGYIIGSNTDILSSDTILGAFGKTQAQINAKLDANTPITGATKTKITYGDDGLITSGTDATTADISDSTNKRYVSDIQRINMDASMLGVTGVITGGVVSINADPTKIDVTAGTGCFIDWTTPSNPVYRPVSWSSVTGASVPVGSGTFSYIEVTDAGHTGTGTITITANKSVSAENRRNTIRLGLVSHADLTAITSISRYQAPAWQTLDSLIDYVVALGNVNSGNTAYAASNNLTIAKTSGTTTGLYLNYNNNPHSPSTVINSAVSPVSFVTSRRNGSGGFVYSALSTVISPDVYDTGAASLTAVSNNKFTIQRIYFGGASDVYTVTYGQAEYGSISAAEAAIFSESPILNPQVTTSANFVTALIVKKGCTDLSNSATAKFVNISQRGIGGNSGGDVVGDDTTTTVQNIVAYNTTGGKNITELTGTQGDILYHNGTSWVKLPAGISGQFLKTNGPGANPSWATP